MEIPCGVGGMRFYGNCSVGAYTYFNGSLRANNAHFGRFCSIAAGAVIGANSHPTDRLSTHPFTIGDRRKFKRNEIYQRLARGDRPADNPVVIGNDVWIGTYAVVLP
ncbi:MAG: hypothetical protein EOP49_25400, partial [Sphingobacteriales bacterium]